MIQFVPFGVYRLIYNINNHEKSHSPFVAGVDGLYKEQNDDSTQILTGGGPLNIIFVGIFAKISP